MIKIVQHGDFSKTTKFLQKVNSNYIQQRLEKYGDMGVQALAEATPKDTGATANSWYYKTHVGKNSVRITWYNDNMPQGIPVAVLIQYGHATKNGGFVEGIDYINPVMQPLFDRIADDIWKEVVSE